MKSQLDWNLECNSAYKYLIKMNLPTHITPTYEAKYNKQSRNTSFRPFFEKIKLNK